MQMNRRHFLVATSGLAMGTLGGCTSTTASSASSTPTFSISLAEWSLHRTLGSGKMTNLDFPVVARRTYGIDAVEYVNSFFKDKARDAGYLKELSGRCAGEGVTSVLIMVDGEGELGASDDARRLAAVKNHEKWIDCAATLGCTSIRVNAGGDGGPEELAARAADSLVRLADYGASVRMNVIVENHGGWSSNGAWLAGVMRRANHPRVGTLPDFGNFNLGGGRTYDRYVGVAEMMPFAKAVSAKSHAFDASGAETGTDYFKMMDIVLAAGYRGRVGIEYEGDAHSEHDGILLTKALLERVRSEIASKHRAE